MDFLKVTDWESETEKRVEEAMENFRKGYNCAQAVGIAFADCYGVPTNLMARMASSFGGGIGRMRETCGAACGMFLLAGLEVSNAQDTPDAQGADAVPYPDAEVKKKNYEVVQRLASDFFAGTPDKCFAALAVSALFNNASFMLYCGQELGERGMDNEGFSGIDGKSTIFDWWKPRSSKLLWQWVHKGTGLEAKDKAILDKYHYITMLASMDVFRNGSTYDLCFCNLSSEGFDPDRHFAFLRYNDEICYLVVCNFSSSPMSAVVDIPLRGRRERVEVAPYDYCIKELR